MEHSPGYRNYEAYEAAMERLSEGKKASFRLTFVKTERGVRVFNDGLQVRSVCAGCCRTWRTASIPRMGRAENAFHLPDRDIFPGGCWRCRRITDGISPPRSPAGDPVRLSSDGLFRHVAHGRQPGAFHKGQLPDALREQPGDHDLAGYRPKGIRPTVYGRDVPSQERVRRYREGVPYARKRGNCTGISLMRTGCTIFGKSPGPSRSSS